LVDRWATFNRLRIVSRSVPANFHFIESFSQISVGQMKQFRPVDRLCARHTTFQRPNRFTGKPSAGCCFWKKDAAQQSPPHQVERTSRLPALKLLIQSTLNLKLQRFYLKLSETWLKFKCSFLSMKVK
jgi:hypothetical protein